MMVKSVAVESVSPGNFKMKIITRIILVILVIITIPAFSFANDKSYSLEGALVGAGVSGVGAGVPTYFASSCHGNSSCQTLAGIGAGATALAGAAIGGLIGGLIGKSIHKNSKVSATPNVSIFNDGQSTITRFGFQGSF